MISKRFADKIAQHKPAFGLSLRYHDPAIIEMIGGAWDFLWIDVQHGMIGPEHLAHLIRTCDLTGTTSLVRLPKDATSLIGLSLDLDAGGVIIAQVEGVEHARQLVKLARFAPMGERSFGGRRIIDRNGRNYTDRANREQLLFVQIESRAALAQCEAMAAVPGVDGVMLGPDDIRLESGQSLSSSIFEGETLEAVRRISKACHAAGKLSLGFGSDKVADIQTAISAGLDLISISADVLYVARGSAASRAVIDGLDS